MKATLLDHLGYKNQTTVPFNMKRQLIILRRLLWDVCLLPEFLSIGSNTEIVSSLRKYEIANVPSTSAHLCVISFAKKPECIAYVAVAKWKKNEGYSIIQVIFHILCV